MPYFWVSSKKLGSSSLVLKPWSLKFGSVVGYLGLHIVLMLISMTTILPNHYYVKEIGLHVTECYLEKTKSEI